MNTIAGKYFKLVAYVILLSVIVSCKEDEKELIPPVFSKISSINELDVSVSSGEMGDWIALQGSNIETTNSVYFNDVAVDMQEVYYENNILYMQVPIAMPSEINNKVKVVTEGGEFEFDFTVNIPEIKLTHMFNEYTAPGDTMKIYGEFFGLYEVDPSNTVISFNGIEKSVIDVGDNYITVGVPENTDKNIKLQLINSKYNATAECPGYYYDRQSLVTNFDDVPYKGTSGVQYVGLWDAPEPLSGNYSLLTVDAGGSGWSYLVSNGFAYSEDMKDHPDKYEIKFELNMILPIMNTNFYIYNYWNHTPAQITASDLVVQKTGVWQTIRIPLEKLIPTDFSGNKDYIGSFNIRIDSPAGEPLKMGWDNFRVSQKD
uniref:glycan-binding surface protein n=1 Tax=uncultured Draconibacterium sp. TaxID=1573823 RepID=UPI0032164866